MSVINQFEAEFVRYTYDPAKIVYVKHMDRTISKIGFDIHCVAKASNTNSVYFFFNMKDQRVFVCIRNDRVLSPPADFSCAIIPFWFSGDYPVLSTVWLHGQEHIMDMIHEEFKRQHADYVMDNIIND